MPPKSLSDVTAEICMSRADHINSHVELWRYVRDELGENPTPDMLRMSSMTSIIHQDYKIYNIYQGRQGKRRRIEEPVGLLKDIQKLLVSLYTKLPLHQACMSQKGKSILDNAMAHANARHILRVDIKNCYPTTTVAMIERGMSSILTANGTSGMPSNGAIYAANNFSLLNGVLPTGAPTSPILCNIALYPVDIAVQWIADQNGYTYTRYMDDIHLSTTDEKRKWELKDEIENVLKAHGYTPNYRKNRWMTNNETDNVIITGVRIGTTEKVPRSFRRMIRAKLQNLAMKGKDIDAETRGCLAYIQSLDPNRYESLMAYYHRRRAYDPQDSQCDQKIGARLEQTLSSSPSINSTECDSGSSNR